MSAGYDPFYWLDWEVDKEYEEQRKESENDQKSGNGNNRADTNN